MVKLLYKLFGIVFGLLGGIIAGAVFSKAWKVLAHEDDAPDATDEERRVEGDPARRRPQGSDRGRGQGGAPPRWRHGVRGLTGTWPA